MLQKSLSRKKMPKNFLDPLRVYSLVRFSRDEVISNLCKVRFSRYVRAGSGLAGNNRRNYGIEGKFELERRD